MGEKNEVRTNIVSLNEQTLVHLDFEGKTTVYLQYVDCTKHSTVCGLYCNID